MSLLPRLSQLNRLASQPHFGAYRLEVDQQGQTLPQVTFSQPALDADSIEVKTRVAGSDQEPVTTQLHRKPVGDHLYQWQAEHPVELPDKGLDYQFQLTKDGKTSTFTDQTYKVGDWNRIVPAELTAAHKQGPVLDVYNASVLPSQFSRELEKSQDPFLLNRSHFIDHRLPQQAGKTPPSNVDGLVELLKVTEPYHYRELLVKPPTGGAPSTHGYDTADFYSQNLTTGQQPTQYRRLIGELLKRDMKIKTDLATNIGLASVPMWSIMLHGPQSPYWQFMNFDREPKFGPYPKVMTDDKLTLGILPTRINPTTGLPEANTDHLGIRIIHPPNEQGKFDREPYIQFYNAGLYTPEGHLKPHGPERADYDDPMWRSSDALNQMRFPLPPQIADKLKALEKEGIQPVKVNGQLVLSADQTGGDSQKWQTTLFSLLEYPRFRFGLPSEDNSGMKWHGQVHAVKLNLVDNEPTRAHVRDALAYNARETRNMALDIVADALARDQQAHPQAEPVQQLRHITASDHPADDKALGPVLPGYQRYEAPEVIARHAQQLGQESPDFQPVPVKQVMAKTAATLVDEVPLGVVPLHLEDGYPLVFKTVLEAPAMASKLQRPDSLAGYGLMVARNLFSLTAGLGGDTSPFRSVEGVVRDELKRAGKTLPAEAQETLRLPLAQSVAMTKLGPDLYTYLLTGKTTADKPQEIVDGFYATVPQSLRTADPMSGPQLLQGFLKKRLQSRDTREWLVQALPDSLKTRNQDNQSSGQWLSPQHLQLAQAVLDNREYGLNVRLDAAKELVDTDQVNDRHPVTRDPHAEKAVDQGLDTWNSILKPLRQIFPQATVVGEWTDDSPETAWMGKQVSKIPKANDSMLNYPLYEFFSAVSHRLRRNDRFNGEGDLSLAKMTESVYSQAKDYPRPFQQSLVNIASVHDNEPLTHNAISNAGLRESDYLRDQGLKDQTGDALQELLTKPAFQPALARIPAHALPSDWQSHLSQAAQLLATDMNAQQTPAEKQQVKQVTEQLHHWIDSATTLSDADKATYKHYATKVPSQRPKDFSVTMTELAFNPKDGVLGDLALSPSAQRVGEQTYQALKQACIQPQLQGRPHPQAILEDRLAQPQTWQAMDRQLDLLGAQAEKDKVQAWVTLKALAAGRVAESSDVKSARAILTNTLQAPEFPWAEVLGSHPESRPAVEQGLYSAFNWAAALDSKNLAYKSLPGVLNRLIDDPRGLSHALTQAGHPDLAQDQGLKDRLKAHLHSVPLSDALSRVATGLVATSVIPGQPSFLATQDLVAATGSERYTNDYQGNRQMMPLHWLQPSAEPGKPRSPYMTPAYEQQYDAHQQTIQQAVSLKSRFPAMADGFILPLHQFAGANTGAGPDEKTLNQDGVFIMPMTNGEQTVISLVNTKKPSSQDTSWWTQAGRIGSGATYPAVKTTQPEVKDWTLDLQRLGLPEGSEFVRYTDNNPAAGEAQRYKLEKGKLSGLTFRDLAVLELVKTPAIPDGSDKKSS